MKNILITGGAGFIGSNLALSLLGKGYHITVYDNLSRQIHGEKPEITSTLYHSIAGKVEFIKDDVLNLEKHKHLVLKQDAIVHFAAETGTGQSMYQIGKYCKTNINGTAVLLDLITQNKHNIQKLIVASSRAIYGEGKYYCPEHGIVFPDSRTEEDLLNRSFDCKCPICDSNVEVLPTSEDSRLNPNSIYGITKLNQEQLVLTMGKSIGLPSLAYRFQNVYGPGQSLTNPYTGILSIFSSLIKKGKEINIFEDGLESRDFVYIDDVITATIMGLENREVKFEAFNVGANNQVSVLQVAQMLMQNYNKNTSYKISGEFRTGDIRHNYADLSKIEQVLKYKPTVDFNDGLKQFCKWVDSQYIPDNTYEISIEELKQKGLLK